MGEVESIVVSVMGVFPVFHSNVWSVLQGCNIFPYMICDVLWYILCDGLCSVIFSSGWGEIEGRGSPIRGHRYSLYAKVPCFSQSH